MTSRKKIFSLAVGATFAIAGVLFFFFPQQIHAASVVCPSEAPRVVGTLASGINHCLSQEIIDGATKATSWGVCTQFGRTKITVEEGKNSGDVLCLTSSEENFLFRPSVSCPENETLVTGTLTSGIKACLSNEIIEGATRALGGVCTQFGKTKITVEEGTYSGEVLCLSSEEAESIPPSCSILDFGCFVINTLFGGIAFIFKALFSALAALVSWAITTLIDIPVLPGGEGTPHFVTEGWNLTRNLVNISFLIVLVFIGFATILRLQSYEMKKTLPMLLIVALLVNFSGVLVGLIVDLANILTNFFVSGISHVSWDMMDTWKGASPGTKADDWVILSYHISRIGFYSIASFVYLSIVAVFFLRIIVLWVLVILAPFAFAAYILPSTRSTSTKWFSALTQWAFVGVPLSFFILLSALTLEAGTSPDALMRGGSSALASFLAPFTSLVILVIGVGMSISSAPSMAGKVMGFGKAYGEMARKWAGQKAETKLKLPEGAKKAGKWLMRNPVTSKIGGVGVGRLLTGYAKGAQKRREDTVQGLSLGQQAAGMGRPIPEHVRKMTPDNFVENVDATEITLEVFHAMTIPQIKAVGAKGTPEQIDIIADIAIKDSDHRIDIAVHATPPPPLTPEQRSIIAKVNELTVNTSFPYP